MTLEVREIENVDKTIDAICDWVQKELKSEVITEKSILPDMVKSLAELVSARDLNLTRHV